MLVLRSVGKPSAAPVEVIDIAQRSGFCIHIASNMHNWVYSNLFIGVVMLRSLKRLAAGIWLVAGKSNKPFSISTIRIF